MKKKDVYNLFFLMSIQGANGIIPLFIYPYVLLKLGSDLYAQVAIAESISVFILTLVIYGFDIDGTSIIVHNRDTSDKNIISEIFSNIFYARVLIVIGCVLVTIIAGSYFSKQLIYLILCWTLIPVGYMLQSSYVYLGFEDNLMVAVSTVIGRAVCIVLVLMLVHSPSDCYRAPFIIGASYVLGGLGSLIHIIAKFKIKFTKISLVQIISTFDRSKEIFFGNLSVILYRDCNLLILGIISSNPLVISAYSIANKLANAFQAVARPLNQLFFPKVIFLLKNATKPDKQTFKIISRMTIYQLLILLLLVFCIAIAGFWVLHYTDVFSRYPGSGMIATYFFIMTVAALIGVCNFMYGSVGLNYLSMRKYYAFAMAITGVITIATGFILAIWFDGIGASVNFIVGELVLLILILRKYNVLEDWKKMVI